MTQCFICRQDKPGNNIALEGIEAAAAPVPMEDRAHIYICYDCLAQSSHGICNVELDIKGITMPVIGTWKIYKDFVNPQ